MYLVGLGLILLLMKYMEMGPVAAWSWLWVLSPFGMAMLWWWWADASGYTKKRAMERENKRKQDRIDSNRENMGTTIRRKRK